MGDRSRIEWTEATWNPVTGCSKVSPGCAHCYAETVTARFAGSPGWISEHRPWTPENAEHNVRLHPERLDQPLRWRRPRMVFVCSMADLFHELVPDEFIARVWQTMIGAEQHTFQVLTKRPERARDWLRNYHAVGEPDVLDDGPIENVWIGVSIENARYTWRADVLREIPAAVRFISAEPLLGSLIEGGRGDSQGAREIVYERYGVEAGIHRDLNVNCGRAPLDLTGIDWLIVGGESGGRHARPMHPEWARELRDACLATTEFFIDDDLPRLRWEETSFFFKQWGSWSPTGVGDITNVRVHTAVRPDGRCVLPFYAEDADEHMVYRGASPKSGGRRLDGREWNEMPRREAIAA